MREICGFGYPFKLSRPDIDDRDFGTLVELRENCPKLMELKLDLSPEFVQIPVNTLGGLKPEKVRAYERWTRTLSAFRNLRRLILYTCLEPPIISWNKDAGISFRKDTYDPDIERLVDSLVLQKQGSSFELIEIRSKLSSKDYRRSPFLIVGERNIKYLTHRYVGGLRSGGATIRVLEHTEDPWDDA